MTCCHPLHPRSKQWNAYSNILCKKVYTTWTALCWVITQRVVVNSYRRFGTTYRSHLQGWRIQKQGCPNTEFIWWRWGRSKFWLACCQPIGSMPVVGRVVECSSKKRFREWRNSAWQHRRAQFLSTSRRNLEIRRLHDRYLTGLIMCLLLVTNCLRATCIPVQLSVSPFLHARKSLYRPCKLYYKSLFLSVLTSHSLNNCRWFQIETIPRRAELGE